MTYNHMTGRLAAYRRWSQMSDADYEAHRERSRQGHDAALLKKIDPEGHMTEAQRERRLVQARRAFALAGAVRSAEVRRARKGE
jgi:hypothetical protein